MVEKKNAFSNVPFPVKVNGASVAGTGPGGSRIRGAVARRKAIMRGKNRPGAFGAPVIGLQTNSVTTRNRQTHS